ncbi:MAG: amino acid ABC transporter substrate-binding protein [Kiritimatiellae bacterium]|nr:amino acid ABC transporter substrate-binding protein [Kiritimatiellia bacterium]
MKCWNIAARRAAALCALLALSAGCGRGTGGPAVRRPHDGPLVLVTTTDTPPYSYRDEATGEVVGIEIDIAREAAAKLGRALEIRRAKFPELLPMVSAGEADMAASGITITEGRRQTVDFSVPYAVEGGMFLYRAGEPMPTMILAEKMRVATMDASTYDFYLCAHNVESIRYDYFSQAVEDLKARRVDTVFYDSCSVKLVAAESGGTLAASRLETRENFGIAVGKGDAPLKEALDESIGEWRAKQ